MLHNDRYKRIINKSKNNSMSLLVTLCRRTQSERDNYMPFPLDFFIHLDSHGALGLFLIVIQGNEDAKWTTKKLSSLRLILLAF